MLSTLPAASTSQDTSGYLYELLHSLGVSAGSARHVQDLLLRPLTILVIVVVALVVSHLGTSLIRRSLRSLRARAAAHTTEEVHPEGADLGRLSNVTARIDMVGRIAAYVWRVVVWVIAILSILGVLGIDLAPFVAGATVIGATIGFGAQTLVRDYLSGFLLLAEDQYRIGESVTAATATGVVEEMTLRVTRLRGDDGTTWYVPNGDIRTLGNTSRKASSTYVDLAVPFTASIERTGQLIKEAATAAAEDPAILLLTTEPPSLLGVENVGPDGVCFRLVLHTRPGGGSTVARAVRAAVVSRLDAEGLFTHSGSS